MLDWLLEKPKENSPDGAGVSAEEVVVASDEYATHTARDIGSVARPS